MSVKVFTKTPRKLLRLIKDAIDEKNIDTWAYDSEGDFYHTPVQWQIKGWMHPGKIVPNECITFGLIGPATKPMTKMEYAVLHGRFVEMLLAHFDTFITHIETSALPTGQDSIL